MEPIQDMSAVQPAWQLDAMRQEVQSLKETTLFQSGCPAVTVNVRWEDWWRVHLLVPVVFQLLIALWTLLDPPSLFRRGRRARHLTKRATILQRVIKAHLHLKSSSVVNYEELHARSLIALYATQVFSSIVTLAVWGLHTYRQSTTVASLAVLRVAACVDSITWVVNRSDFESRSFWEANAIVDAFTILPTFQCGLTPSTCSAGTDWLTLHFLRSYSVLFSFKSLQRTGVLWQQAMLVQIYLQLVLSVLCLLMLMSGAIFTCEILGDPPFLKDSCVSTNAGDKVSLVLLMYWIVNSITTVGYGDFAPKMVLSRLLTCGCIVIGIGKIYTIQYKFGELWGKYQEGTGSYRPRQGVPHVVVIFGLRGRPSNMSTMVTGFLHEILHVAHRRQALEQAGNGHAHWHFKSAKATDWPDVVFFSPALWDARTDGRQGSTFEDFLRHQRLPPDALSRVKYLVGNVTSKADLDRAAIGASTLCYIMTHMNSDAPDEDDRQNIFTAMVLRDLYPGVRLRLMLLRPESKNLAVQSGIEVTRCFSSQELKAALLAQNVRCQGMLPTVSSFFTSVDTHDAHDFLALGGLEKAGAGLPADFFHAEEDGRDRLSDTADRPSTRIPSIRESFRASTPTSSRGFTTGTPSSSKNFQQFRKRFSSASRADMEDELQAAEDEDNEDADEEDVADLWRLLYFQGLHCGVYGFELSQKFEGRTFGEVAWEVYQDTEAVMIGVYESGRLQLCPQYTHRRPLKQGQICLAVASSPRCLDPVRLDPSEAINWRYHIHRMRDLQAEKTRQEGLHVTVARIMQHELRSRVRKGEDHRIGSLRSSGLSSLQVGPVHSEPSYKSSQHGLHRDSVMSTASLSFPEYCDKMRTEASQSHGVSRQLSKQPSREPTLVSRDASLIRLDSGPVMRASLGTSRPEPTAVVVAGKTDSLNSIASPVSNSMGVSARSSILTQGSEDRRGSYLREDDIALIRSSSRDSSAAPGMISARQIIREVRTDLREDEELVLLCVCRGEVWQQIRSFVATLRSPYEPMRRPIVILAPTQAPAGFEEDLGEHVHLLTGSCLSAKTLFDAGILEARSIVVLSGEPPKADYLREQLFRDYQVVLCANQLECWCGCSLNEVFTAYELQNSHSVTHLPRVINKCAVSMEKLLLQEDKVYTHDEQTEPKETVVTGQCQGVSVAMLSGRGLTSVGNRTTKEAARGSSGSLESADSPEELGQKLDESILFNNRVAAGQVFTPELFGAMLGYDFYMPAAIELLEALLMPHLRAQTAFPWQIRVPPRYVGRPFAALFKDMVLGGWMDKMGDGIAAPGNNGNASSAGPVGGDFLRPEAAMMMCTTSSMGMDWSHWRPDADLPETSPSRVPDASEAEHREPALPLCIYRRRADMPLPVSADHEDVEAPGTGDKNFNILTPPSLLPLQKSDWILVLGGERFRDRAQALGLLRGTIVSRETPTKNN